MKIPPFAMLIALLIPCRPITPSHSNPFKVAWKMKRKQKECFNVSPTAMAVVHNWECLRVGRGSEGAMMWRMRSSVNCECCVYSWGMRDEENKQTNKNSGGTILIHHRILRNALTHSRRTAIYNGYISLL